MTGEEALQEIKARKDALAKEAQSNIASNYNVYTDYLKKTAQNENQGALNSYNNYSGLQGTDSARARSAYLNRLASANDAYAEGLRGLDLYRNKIGTQLEADSLDADAAINGIEYKNALYDAQMQYQKERDAVADAQWQKNFDLGYLSSSGTSGRSGSYYSGGSGGGTYSFTDSSPAESAGIASAISGAIGGAGTKYNNIYSDYLLSQVGRAVKDEEWSPAYAAYFLDENGYTSYATAKKKGTDTTYGNVVSNIVSKPATSSSKSTSSAKGASGGAIRKTNVDMTK